MIASSSSLSTSPSSLNDYLIFFAGTLAGILSTSLVLSNRNENQKIDHSTGPSNPLPHFAVVLENNKSLHKVRLREWEDLKWREENGWKGRDLCHNPEGSAVRVLQYYYNQDREEMIGVVWFGPHTESHRGLCHGGAMTSLMDDFCGHMSFLNSGGPWSGATVQVNVALKKPVHVGSVLRIFGKVSKLEGRKVHVKATLDCGSSKKIYATMEGLSIDGVKMSSTDDAVADRTWKVDVCQMSGRLQRRDSSWNME